MTKTFFSASRRLVPDRVRLIILTAALLLLLATGSISRVFAQQAFTLDLGAGDFSSVSTAGFTLPTEMRVGIDAVCLDAGRARPLASTAWILDAGTREPVWQVDPDDAKQVDGRLQRSTAEVFLPAGTYEVYYATHLDWTSDGWNGHNLGDLIRRVIHEIFSGDGWLSGDDAEEQFAELKNRLGIQIDAGAGAQRIEDRDSMAEEFLSRAFLTITGVPDGSYIAEGFELKRPLDIDVYALGEFVDGGRFDYGWIVNVDTRRTVWDMSSSNAEPAGGARKNVVIRETVSLEPGKYAAFYTTDGSHSAADWNAAPPYDPDFWGLTLRVQDAGELRYVSRFEYENINLDDAIVKLRGVGDNEHVSAGFSVLRPLEVRIYAVGEGGSGQMYDYGWILNADTHQRVWVMDYDETDHAGGAEKNRLFDGVVKLAAGDYIAHFITDGSHSFEHWNSTRPYDAAAWGLTIGPVDPDDADRLAHYSPSRNSSTLASLTEVGDNARLSTDFELEKDARVRIYALGEGSDGRMYDFALIENVDTGTVVWEMTYRMTEHAGGARKNRAVNTVLLLPAGRYRVHYTSDGSHSFRDWNDDPPFEPDMWGVTVTLARRAEAS